MTQIASLPSISVEIAFNPTSIYTTTQTWTDVSAYVRTLQTQLGRQHMLDRFEAGTLKSLVNNRTGFFTTTNTVRTRLPIKVTATWNSNTYPIFYGLIDEPDLQQADQLNVDYQLQASDYLKILSLTYLERPTYYSQFVNTGSGNALNWYRMDSLVGPQTTNGMGLSATNVLVDSISGGNGVASGPTQTVQGVLLYDTSVGCDLTNGTGNPVSCLNLTNAVNLAYNAPAFIEFWLVGLNCQNSTLVAASDDVFRSGDYSLNIDGNGFLNANGYGVVTNTVKLNDGEWHHVSYGYDFSMGYRTVVLDGAVYQLDLYPIAITDNLGNIYIGSSISTGTATGTPTLAAYVDEVVVSSSGAVIASITGTGTTATVTFLQPIHPFSAGATVTIRGSSVAGYNGTWTVLTASTNNFTFATSTTGSGSGGFAGVAIVPEIQNRYTAGSRLLRTKSSADMVADVLAVAGFTGFPYEVNQSSYTVGSWAGVCNVNGWTSPVTGSSALDLILLICDTEGGAFYEDGSGNFQFLTRDFPSLVAQLSPVATFTNYDNYYSNQVFYFPNSLQQVQDDMDLWPTVKVTPTNGLVQRYDSPTANQDLYGSSTLTKSTQPPTLADAVGEAQYWGNIYGEPLTRIPSVMLGSETNVGGQLPVMLGANIYERTNFVYKDPAWTVTETPMVIESVAHDFDSEGSYWHTTFVLDPYPVSNAQPFMIWDNATYGIWDVDEWI